MIFLPTKPVHPATSSLRRRDILRTGLLGAGCLVPGVTLAAAAPLAEPGPREQLLLADGWRFHLGHAAELERDFGFGRYQRTFAKVQEDAPPATMPDFDDSDWADVRVPHDWAVSLPFARPPGAVPDDRNIKDRLAAHGFKAIGREFPENSVGWYRRALTIAKTDRDRRIWLEFDGVFRDCLIFINGCIAGHNASGYAPFQVDITDFLDYAGGPNLLTLRVDASLGEGWFYEGAGIYRHVMLVKAAPVHIPQWGVFVRAAPGAGRANARITTEIANQGDAEVSAGLRQTVHAPDGTPVALLDEVALKIAAHGIITHEAATDVTAPLLWSIETPELYTLVSEVRIDGRLVDRVSTRFGIRAIRFDADKGFFLNDRPVKLLGTCNHNDHAGVGTAIPDALNAWRVDQLQDMGSNAWRSAHNPPSQALLDICDAKGMLMIVELRRNTTMPDALGELDRIVRRDRNHPCVILWSTGNEEPQQGMDRGQRITAELMRRIKTLDPTRPITQAFYGEDKGYGIGAWNVVDVAGLNYRTDKNDAFHAQYPHLPIIGTETGSTTATRGEYANDPVRHVVRAYDTEYPFWASTAEQWWPIVADRSYIAGGFVWTGFDYRGEPTPYPSWPSVSSQFGVLDLCGFPKDDYYYYRAWWRPHDALVHLLPHWNWPGREGKPVEVWAHGNCDEIELLVNGVSAGRKAMPRNGHLVWTVNYAPGRIEARGFIGGHRATGAIRETTGAAVAVRVIADRQRFVADGADVAVVRAEVVDRAGRIVPDAAPLIHFAIEGDARVIGVGNGDPNSHEADQASSRWAFHGLCQALVQIGSRPGSIRISAAANGLLGGSTGIFALSAG